MDNILDMVKRLIAKVKPQENDFYKKYFNADYEVPKTIDLIGALEIHRYAKRLSILDISTCFGYLPFLIKHYMEVKHDVDYTDCIVPEHTSPIEVRKVFGLNKCKDYQCNGKGGVYFHKPIPYKKKFDFILASSVIPHSYFSETEWGKFIDNCLELLKKDGVIYLAPNRGEGRNVLERVLRAYKGEIYFNGYIIRKG